MNASVVRSASESSGGDYEQILQTHALIGQILVFRTARATLLRRLGTDRLTQRDIDAIAGQILVLTLRAIDADQLTGKGP